MASRFALHLAEWENCDRCGLAQTRRRIVLSKGCLPCDVLFIGEAPGESEDAIGRPFIGPAGKVLDDIIREAWGIHCPFRLAFTNLVGCIPLGDDGNKTKEPPKESIEACRPRLLDYARIAQPKAIVHVGKLSKQYGILGQSSLGPGEDDWQPPWIPDGRFIEFQEIIHPAAILREHQTNRPLLLKRAVARLRELTPYLEQ